jgi:hypothetical protein
VQGFVHHCLVYCVGFCTSLLTTIYKTIHRRRDNTMAKRKSTNNNLQNNTQKDRQYNDQKKNTFSFGHCVVCPSVYCFVDCCMYFFFWPLYCLSFCVLFCRLLFVLQSTKQYTEGQTIQWPTEKVQITIYKTIHRRTDSCLSFCVLFCRLLYVLFLSAIVLSVLLCIVL